MTLDNFSDTTPESNMNRRAVVAGSALAAIGAITNVASALLLEPELANRIVVVWLGGHPHD